MGFSDASKEALKWYVYSLVDPRPSDGDRLGSYFYIGKGKGDRVFQHWVNGIVDAQSKMTKKMQTIQAIRNAGYNEPQFEIIAHDLTEKEAFQLESQLIGVMDHLTNLAGGHYGKDYWLSKQQIEERYDHPLLDSDLPGPTLFVSLNGGGENKLMDWRKIANDPEALASRTLGNWPITRNIDQVEYIIGCYKGLARCAFKVTPGEIETIEPTQTNGHTRRRWTDASPDSDLEKMISGRTIERESLGKNRKWKSLTKFPPGKSCQIGGLAGEL